MSGFTVKKFFAGVALLSVSSLGYSASYLTSDMTVDNYYEFRISTDDSVAGRLLYTGGNWKNVLSTSSITLEKGKDYYIHIKAVDYEHAQGFLGDFTITGNDHTFEDGSKYMLTGSNNWKVSKTGWGVDYETPKNIHINHGHSLSWGYGMAKIDRNAWWTWSNDLSADNVWFSAKIEATSEVPVPAAAWLFGSAILGLAGLKRKS